MSDDLYSELHTKTKQLDASLRQLRSSLMEKAESEKSYKMLLAKECLKLRDAGMPATLIDKVCYGLPEVAEARFRRDVAEGLWQANMEAINVTKLELRLLEGQISREWAS